MIKIISALRELPGKVRRFCSPSLLEVELFNFFQIKPRAHISRAKGVVLIECVEDVYYFGLFGEICSALKSQQNVLVDQLVVRSVNVGEGASLRWFFYLRVILNRLHNFKWISLYRGYCDRIGYRNSNLNSPLADMIDFWRAFRAWKRLGRREDLLGLSIDGIAVGDLINDTFLRFKPAITVDLKDTFLLVMIWQAYSDFRRAKNYFSSVRPVFFLLSYSTYTQHGIPARVAIEYDVKVLSFGNLQEFSKKLSKNDWVPTKNPLTYAKDFSKLENQDEKIARADVELANRLSGGIDGATAYMKKSSYIESGESAPAMQGAIVVFLHDFFDSPHVYYDLVFPDFWMWICFTIETLTEAGLPFFLKPHPNQISLGDDVIHQLKARYPHIALISPAITNVQLVKAGMVKAVTVYGTVAHEMAYLGIPSVTCARHPHVAFDFCLNAKTKEEYAMALIGSRKTSIDALEMRRQSLVFYYMHNLNLDREDADLRNALIDYRNICADAGANPKQVVQALEKLSTYSSFNAFIAMLKRDFNNAVGGEVCLDKSRWGSGAA